MEGARAHALGVRRTYPDLHVTIERQIAEGEWVVSCITARGTHEGEWLGIEPTGTTLTFTGVNVDRVVDGRIVEHGGAANMLGPLLDAGAVRVGGRSYRRVTVPSALAPSSLRRLQRPGGSPVQRRNARLKALVSLNPSRNATSAIDTVGSAR